MKKVLLLSAILIGAISASYAGVSFRFDFPLPPGIIITPHHARVYAPPPVYMPPPVYEAPPVCEAPPVYPMPEYDGPPVVVGPPVIAVPPPELDFRFGGHRYWRGDRDGWRRERRYERHEWREERHEHRW